MKIINRRMPMPTRNIGVVEILPTLNRWGFNPIEAMIKIAQDESVDISVRRLATKDLLDRIVPVRKHVEKAEDEMVATEVEEFKRELKLLISQNQKEY